MTKVLASDGFATIHLVGIIALIAMLWHARLRGAFEERCVGHATAIDLAWVRIVACSVLILYIFTEDLGSLARLDARNYDWPGYLIYLKRGVLRFFVESEPHLAWVTGVLFGTLVLGLLGIATRVTIPLATATYLLYAALLRSFGKYFHDGYLAMYVMMALTFLPCGDAWSLDARWRKRRGKPPRTAAYNWMVWACFAALCVPYLQLATSKLVNGGLTWIDGRSLRNYMITDDLNLTEWDIDVALHAIGLPTILWTIAGFFALATEVTYPFVLVSPRLRRFLPYGAALLHLGVWFGQDALFLDAIVMPLVFLTPSRWFRAPEVTHEVAHKPPRPTRWSRARAWLRGPGIALCLVAAMLAIDHSTYRVSFKYKWPLEGWQMYAGKMNLDPTVNYRRFVAHYPDGRRAPTGLAECAAFLEKPYRLDFGLIHDLPGFLSTCATRIRGADALIYETRTWAYKKRTLDEHLTDPPDHAFTLGLVAPPPAELRAGQPATSLVECPDFEQIDLATGIPRSWIVPEGGFVGLGFDPGTKNHALLITRVPVPAGAPAAPAQSVRQPLTFPKGTRAVAASVLARTAAPGAQLVIEADGVPRATAAVPADGAWHRVEATASVPGDDAKLAIALVAADDTYFDDAVTTVVDPAGTAAPAR